MIYLRTLSQTRRNIIEYQLYPVTGAAKVIHPKQSLLALDLLEQDLWIQKHRQSSSPNGDVTIENANLPLVRGWISSHLNNMLVEN